YHRAFLKAIEAGGGVKPVPAKVVPLPVPKPAVKSTVLIKGSRGDEVAQLIRDLHALGFYHGRLDDIFGGQTEKAVFAFQHAHGLDVDGKAGPQTLGSIAGVLVAAGSRSAVTFLDGGK